MTIKTFARRLFCKSITVFVPTFGLILAASFSDSYRGTDIIDTLGVFRFALSIPTVIALTGILLAGALYVFTARTKIYQGLKKIVQSEETRKLLVTAKLIVVTLFTVVCAVVMEMLRAHARGQRSASSGDGQKSNDYQHHEINPASGLPMMDNYFDIEGNAYGTEDESRNRRG